MSKEKVSSVALQLAQAAILVAALVPLGSVSAEASSITCSYANSGATHCSAGGEGGGTSAFYRFDPDNDSTNDYFLTLTFDQVNATSSDPFHVTIEDFLRTPAEMSAKFAANFPGYTCVPIFGTSCVEFVITADAPGPTTWTSAGPRDPSDPAFKGYTIDLFWLADTDGSYPNAPGNFIRLLHDTGPSPTDGQYDFDMTTAGSYFACAGDECFDPGISGQDNNFDTFTAATSETAVPEPISALLVATGLGGLWSRRQRAAKIGQRSPNS